MCVYLPTTSRPAVFYKSKYWSFARIMRYFTHTPRENDDAHGIFFLHSTLAIILFFSSLKYILHVRILFLSLSLSLVCPFMTIGSVCGCGSFFILSLDGSFFPFSIKIYDDDDDDDEDDCWIFHHSNFFFLISIIYLFSVHLLHIHAILFFCLINSFLCASQKKWFHFLPDLLIGRNLSHEMKWNGWIFWSHILVFLS